MVNVNGVPSLQQQLDELNRELGMRNSVYPRRIADKRMTPAQAEWQVACLRAAIATIAELAKNEGIMGT